MVLGPFGHFGMSKGVLKVRFLSLAALKIAEHRQSGTAVNRVGRMPAISTSSKKVKMLGAKSLGSC